MSPSTPRGSGTHSRALGPEVPQQAVHGLGARAGGPEHDVRADDDRAVQLVGRDSAVECVLRPGHLPILWAAETSDNPFVRLRVGRSASTIRPQGLDTGG
ncbi:MAG: hypothetical protein JWN22_1402 [Nocardioides sp.]|nr:hypothetical protein [Nocardioides sp.]